MKLRPSLSLSLRLSRYAIEARARAAALRGDDKEGAKRLRAEARAAGQRIKGEDRRTWDADFELGPWFENS